MDIWMVAVAAGAGYLAQHFKDLKKSCGRITSESSSKDSDFVKPDSPKQPPGKKCLFRRFVKREKIGEDDSQDTNEVSHGVYSTQVTSSSQFDGEKGVILGNYEGSGVFCTSNLFPGFIGSDGVLGDDGVRVSEIKGDLLLRPLTPEVGSCYGSPRNRSTLRSRRTNRRPNRPLSSLESCLTAQLFKEHVEMEEYMLHSFASPSMQAVRPFFVTDGSQVISRASGDVFVVEKKLQRYSEENDVISGVPPLPNIGFLKSRGKDRVNTQRDRRGRLSNSSTTATGKHSEHFNLPGGSSHGTLLLCLGMSFGIMSSFMANRREVEKLNGLLKQTENLVQDLHEELEMKDSLVVQELTVEDDKSQQMCSDDSFERGSPHSIADEHRFEESTRSDNREFIDQKAKDDSLSKIEAELEAELQMLELNMTSSSVKGRFPNLVELHPDYVPDLAQGELRADVFGMQARDQAYADLDGSGSTPAHSANYAVSPRELSLRLHEVLKSQLEERIRELEAEIKKKQSQNQKSFQSWKDFENPTDEPVVLNLLGEALDAYNEAYEEFSKTNDSEDDDLPQGATHLAQTDQANHSGTNETPRNGKDFGDDEMEKVLIEHIVEKVRKGSPVVLNAQRVLFSMDLE